MTTAADAHLRMHALPFRVAADIVSHTGILVVAPHPDDEVLGCAGLIMSLVAANIPVTVVFVTDGAGSHPNSRTHPASVLRQLREEEALRAADILGVTVDHVMFLRCTDTAAPHAGPAFADMVDKISTIVAATQSGTICAPWRHDPHCDHLAAHLMAKEVARRCNIRHLSYPVWGWTLPPSTELGETDIEGSRLDLAGLDATKHRALAAHASQLGTVITDDPTGFSLDATTLARLIHPFEVFLTKS